MQDGCSSKSIVHMSHVRDEKGIMKEEENHEIRHMIYRD